MTETALCCGGRTRTARSVSITIVMLLATVLTAAPASAQLSRIGNNPYLGAAPARGTATAYDPVNNIFLVVGGTSGNDVTPLYGVFVNAGGAPLTAPFQINAPGEQNYFARVTYSPHVNGSGGFMVVWHGGVPPSLRVRAVVYPNGPIGSIGSVGGSNMQEASPGIAYSPVSQKFLAVWQSGGAIIYGAIFNLSAQQIAGPFPISNGLDAGSRDPSVTWNSQTDEFGVLFTGYGGSGATTTFARVNTAGTVLRTNRFNFTAGTFITDIQYNPSTGNYIGAWFQGGTYGAEINASGDIVATGLLSTATGARDGLGLAYNPRSGTLLMSGQGPSWNIWAAELNSRGARTSADTEVTLGATSPGSFHPRTAANTNGPEWNIAFMRSSAIHNQVVRTSSTAGGPQGVMGPPPGTPTPTPTPTPVPPPGTCTTPDPFTAIGGGICKDGGWIPAPPPAPAPPPPTPIPPPVQPPIDGGCTTPDPFIAMGGGICRNGGWTPGPPPAATPPPTTPTPPPTPPPPGGCTTPDPFVAMGGGHCENGGWVPGPPPGVPPPTPPPAPPPVPPVNGCTTPDPFEALGGGTCIDNGWVFGKITTVPGGCTTPDPFVAIGGGICINRGWVPKG